VATIKYGAVVTELRGSIGGMTFQTSNRQLTLRTKNKCKTQFQSGGNKQEKTALKNHLAYVASFWRTLSPAEQANYAAAAPSFPFYDKYGVAYTPSAFQLFCWQNLNWLNVGQTAKGVAPVPVTLPDFSGLTFTVDTTTNYKLNWTNKVVGNWKLSLFTGRGFSSGKASFNSSMKQVATPNVTGLNSLNDFAGYSAIFGTPITGQKYQIIFKAISIDQGIASSPYIITTICA